MEKIKLLLSVAFVVGTILVFAFNIPTGGSGGDSNPDISVEKTSLTDTDYDRFTTFAMVESEKEDQIVIVGRLVSNAGIVNGLESHVSTDNDTVYVGVTFEGPNKSPRYQAQVVSVQDYRVVLDNTHKYDYLVVNGEGFEL